MPDPTKAADKLFSFALPGVKEKRGPVDLSPHSKAAPTLDCGGTTPLLLHA